MATEEIIGETPLLSKGCYEGEMKDGWFHGKGKFKFNTGVVYEGEFSKGRFHGKGVMTYPGKGKFEGTWERGKLIDGKYTFADGLEFEEPNKWDFCTYKDRRFYHERQKGIENPEIEKYADGLFRKIPPGSYDTGDGYYQPEKGTIKTYDHKFLREPTEDEEEWIKLKCRYEPRKEEDIKQEQKDFEEGDEVISNIFREYQFVKYSKNK